MIPNNFEYKRASNVQEALELMGDDAKILAGGHSLIPALKLRFDHPETLIDISRLRELRSINDGGDHINVGAAATHYDITSNSDIQINAPALAEGAGIIGDLQVRNKGTIGGSIAHADPAADYPGILLACDASISVRSASGSREIAAGDFFVGFFTTALNDGEIITEVKVPKQKGKSAYRKFEQPASRYAIVGVAAYVEVEGGKCTHARIGVNGLSTHAFRATAVENALIGNDFNPESIASACEHIADGVDASSDHFASSDYRTHLAKVYARKALEATL